MTAFIIYKAIMCAAVFLLSLGVAAYATLWERKFAAFLQDRKGPSRAGPGGLLQPIADGVKMFMKEEIIPNVSNRSLFIIGPCLFMVTAVMTSVVIPWAKPMMIGGHLYDLQITDINIGTIYLLGVVSIGVYGIMIGGWASNNKFALLGAVRASSQMISYEIAMGIALIALIISSGGSLSLKDIIEGQDKGFANIVWQPLGFLIFFICALAETNRAPFDLPECETELVGGYHTEYSSMKLGLFLFAEYINMFISSAIMAGFYFGGYNFPFASELYAKLGLVEGDWLISLIGFGAYFTKIVIFICVFMWVRWTLPRFRYDQLMNLGWKTLLPLSLFNLALTVVVEYFRGNIHF
ncbi:MAG TPA: NADH-quinone oxidoreductase subunit NuoH [Bacteroidia bacterium]|nr:NADH-quinone oxidoreductase subunit NuoH [Bacteroidia bacterium]